MSKRSRASSAANVQLFPFLAVLLCAMGGLILLLVVITGKNRSIGKILNAAALQQRIALAEQRNEVELDVDFQSEARDRTAQQLAGHRAALAMLEDQARKTRDEIEELKSAIAQLQQNTQVNSINKAELSAQIGQLVEQTKLKDEELKKLREQMRVYEDSFAVVPYEGPNSTRRRPIYIECVAAAVVLQPEGIRLNEDDFVFSDGPNNPLAAALRAARDYLVKNRYVDGKDNGEPYPLLLVRPEGIGAYYAARHAMTSWGSEFGYELIDSEWKIAYRPVDPGLTLAMTRAVDDARQRAVALAKAAPGLLDPEQRKIYRSAFAAGRGSGGGESGGGDSLLGRPGGRSSANKDRFASGLGDANNPEGGNGFAGNSTSGSGSGFGPGREGAGSGSAAGQAFSGSAAGQAFGQHDDPSTLPYGNIATNRTIPNSGSLRNAATRQSSGNGSNNLSANGGDGGNGGDQAASGAGQNSAPGGAGGGGSNRTAMAGKGSNPAASSGGSPGNSPDASQGNGGGQPSTVTASVDASQSTTTVTVTPQSLAAQRGRDWGLPEKARNSVPLTRPISVRVTSKDLTLLSETGNPLENKKVLLKPQTEASVDEFVKQIWGHVESWNLAGVGMHWRPVIVAQVAPDGQQRFQDLQVLMTDSGLEVKQKMVVPRNASTRR